MPEPPLAVFCPDAGPRVGGGHLVRCLTLADHLADVGWECWLITTREGLDLISIGASSCVSVLAKTPPELADMGRVGAMLDRAASVAIVDGYNFTCADESSARGWAKTIVAIDDQPARDHDCDLLLDQTLGRNPDDYLAHVPHHALVLAGADFTLLDKRFREIATQVTSERKFARDASLAISFGASDENDLTSRVLVELNEMGWRNPATIALPAAAPHFRTVQSHITRLTFPVSLISDAGSKAMAEIFSAADIGVGGAGASTWERAVVGLPSIMVVLAENQATIAASVAAAGAAVSLGRFKDLRPNIIAAEVRMLADNPERRAAMSSSAAQLCDGYGAQRAAGIIDRIARYA